MVPIPPDLLLAWHLGDSRFPRSGGILDQRPDYLRATYAHAVWQALGEIAKPKFNATEWAEDASKMRMLTSIMESRERVKEQT